LIWVKEFAVYAGMQYAKQTTRENAALGVLSHVKAAGARVPRWFSSHTTGGLLMKRISLLASLFAASLSNAAQGFCHHRWSGFQCVFCGDSVSQAFRLEMSGNCWACSFACWAPSPPQKSDALPQSGACADDPTNRAFAAAQPEHAYYTIDASPEQLLDLARVNAIAALFVLEQTPNRSSIALGAPVNLASGRFSNARISTVRIVEMLLAGTADVDAINESQTSLGDGLRVDAEFRTTPTAQGGLEVELQTWIRDGRGVTVHELHPPVTLIMGGGPRTLQANRPFGESPLQSFPFAGFRQSARAPARPNAPEQ
jgi:hypothetical protein